MLNIRYVIDASSVKMTVRGTLLMYFKWGAIKIHVSSFFRHQWRHIKIGSRDQL